MRREISQFIELITEPSLIDVHDGSLSLSPFSFDAHSIHRSVAQITARSTFVALP